MRVLAVLSLAALLAAPATGVADAAPAALAVPSAAPQTVTGRVTDALTGAPLAGRRVVATADGSQREAAVATTDASGRYRLSGLSASRHYLVQVERRGDDDPHLDTYAPGALNWQDARWVLPPATVDIAVQPGYRIAGTWRNSGVAPDAESVWVEHLDSGDVTQVQPDDRGAWTAWVPAGRHVVSFVRADKGGQFWFGGGASRVADDVAHAAVLRVGPGLPAPVLTVTQPRDALVRIRVVDAVTRRPLTQPCVLDDAGSRTEPGTAPPNALHVVQDSCDGELAVRPGRDVVRVAEQCGHIPTLFTVDVRRGSVRTYTVALRRGGTVTGRAVDAATGRPVADPLVDVLPRRGWPDVERWDCPLAPELPPGRFEQVTVPPGLLTVVVAASDDPVDYPGRYAPGTDDPKRATVFRLRPGRILDVGTVRLRRGGIVRGRVLDPAGRPLAGATVTPFVARDPAAGNDLQESATTDALGRYVLRGVKGVPTVLRIEPPAWSPLPVQWLGGADERHATAVRTRWGATVTAPDARLRRGGTLRVRVLRAGVPVRVEALDAAGRHLGAVARVGTDGVAALTGLPATAVKVHVWSDDVQHPGEAWWRGRRFADADPVVVRAGRTTTITVASPAHAGTADTLPLRGVAAR